MNRALLALALAGLAGCGARRDELAECTAQQPLRAEGETLLPACVRTERGVMPVERAYIPGVVDCELGWFTRARAGLEAQAIAARTFLAGFLRRSGAGATVPIGPRFQCWRATKRARSVGAAAATADVVLTWRGRLITANYAAGTRHLDAQCRPLPPAVSDYDGYASWQAMRAAWVKARRAGRKKRFPGVYWTQILVTDNEGRGGERIIQTPHSPPWDWNRGGLGQYQAVCLAEAGYSTEAVLRHFYGADVELSTHLPGASELSTAPEAPPPLPPRIPFYLAPDPHGECGDLPGNCGVVE